MNYKMLFLTALSAWGLSFPSMAEDLLHLSWPADYDAVKYELRISKKSGGTMEKVMEETVYASDVLLREQGRLCRIRKDCTGRRSPMILMGIP